MSCTKWEDQIYLYTDGVLGKGESEVLLTHIHQCESCAKLLAEIETINGMLKEEGAHMAPPEGFAAGVMAALPKAPWQSEEQNVVPFAKKQRNGKRLTRWGTAVAAAVLVAAVGVSQLPQGGEQKMDFPWQDGWSVANYLPQLGENLRPASSQPEQPPIAMADNDITTTQPRNNDGVKPPVQSQPKNNTVDQTISGSGEVVLPKVAAGKEKTGIYSLLLLASSEDGDVLNPVVTGSNTVEYFIRSDYGTSKWQSNPTDAEEPVLLEDNAKLGAAQSVNTVTKAEWLTDSSYTEALSPLGDMTLLNSMSGDGGLWKIVSSQDTEPKLLHQASGGNLLSWSPDGTKAIYTDKAGNLYVVYPTEEVVMLVFEGNVTSVSWGQDSRMIAFSARSEGAVNSAVYSAMLP